MPTTLSPDGRSHPPHLHTWHDGWRHLRFLLMYSPQLAVPLSRYRFNSRRICRLRLAAARSASIGEIVFDVHTLAYAFGSMLVGFQLLTFAVFTKIFAITEGLLPEDPRLNRFFEYIKLETGLIAGALFVDPSEWRVRSSHCPPGREPASAPSIRKHSSHRLVFRLCP